MIISKIFDDWKRYNIERTIYDKPVVRKDGPKLWTLAEPSVYTWLWDRGPEGVCVRSGFTLNGASVPRALRGIVDPEMLFDSSILHDLGYAAHGGDRPVQGMQVVDWYTNLPISWSKERVDALFFAFALASGVPVAMAEQAYVAVYLAGGPAWNDQK